MDKFVSPEQPPEGHEREILTILAEECAEVTQRVSKALRFGVAEVQPGQPHSNADRIADEVGDLLGVLDRAFGAGLLSEERVERARGKKHMKLAKFMQTAPVN